MDAHCYALVLLSLLDYRLAALGLSLRGARFLRPARARTLSRAVARWHFFTPDAARATPRTGYYSTPFLDSTVLTLLLPARLSAAYAPATHIPTVTCYRQIYLMYGHAATARGGLLITRSAAFACLTAY